MEEYSLDATVGVSIPYGIGTGIKSVRSSPI